MADSAHDKEHVYRVLYTALDIAKTEESADLDILITACLLHDIGRREQNENPALCHAEIGAQKARAFLEKQNYPADFVNAVCHCIETHRFRSDNPPKSIEAKILFDADKIDATGTLGIARTLLYNGREGEPLYSLNGKGYVSDGKDDTEPSFFQEYRYKLENVYSRFLTRRGAEIALSRQNSAASFYENMLKEVSSSYAKGKDVLTEYLK